VFTVRRDADTVGAVDRPEFLEVFLNRKRFFLQVVDAQITFVKNDKGEVST